MRPIKYVSEIYRPLGAEITDFWDNYNKKQISGELWIEEVEVE